MSYQFDVDVAMAVGVEAACVFQNIAYWCSYNITNNKNYYDGNYWTYNSAKAFEKQFPFFNARKISRLLDSLKEAGLIDVGSYNKQKYDRTKWYAVTTKGWQLLENTHLSKMTNGFVKNVNSIDKNCQMDLQEMSNGFTENVEPIPDINSNINSNDIPPQEEEDVWQTVIHLYENNIRPLTSRIELDRLYSLYTDFGQMWLSAAITEAVENGAHNIKYITAILDRWKVDGFKADRRAKKTQAKKDAAPPEKSTIRDGIDWSRFDG